MLSCLPVVLHIRECIRGRLILSNYGNIKFLIISIVSKLVEGVGWKATITPITDGVQVLFDAHDELLDDLLRRFEDMAERAV